MVIKKIEVGWVNDDFCSYRYTLRVQSINENYLLFKFYPQTCEIFSFTESEEGVIQKEIDHETFAALIDCQNIEWHGFGEKMNNCTLRIAIKNFGL